MMSNARVFLLLFAALALAAVGAGLTPAVQSGIGQLLLRRSVDPAVELESARFDWDGALRVRDLRLRSPGVQLTVADAELHVWLGSLWGAGRPLFREVQLRGCVIEPLAATRIAETWREQLRASLAATLVSARLEAEGEVRLPGETGRVGFRIERCGWSSRCFRRGPSSRSLRAG